MQTVALSAAIGSALTPALLRAWPVVRVQTDLDARLPPIQTEPSALKDLIGQLLTTAASALDGPGLVTFSTGRSPGLHATAYLTVSAATPEGDAALTGSAQEPLRALAVAAGATLLPPADPATITVRFSLAAAPLSAAPPELLATGEPVLVVDDDPEVRRLVERFVQRLGFETRAAADGAAALAILRTPPLPRCVILDITMGGMSGDELLAALDTARIAVPIVLMSGYSANDLSRHMRPQRRLTALQKPFTLPELRSAIEQVLR